MTIVTIRPGSDVYVGSVSFTGAATGWQATNDTNNATYAAASTSVGWPKAILRMRPATGGLGAIGASQRILRVRLNATIRANAATTQSAAIKLAMRSDTNRNQCSQYDNWETMYYNNAVTFTTAFGTWRPKPPQYWGSEWTVNAVQGTAVEVQWLPAAVTGVNLRLSELYWDVDYRDAPTVTAISITNPTASTHPTVSWQFNPNFDGDPQVAYQVKIFRSDQYTVFGFNPATTPSHWDSGVQIGNANQTVVGTSLDNGRTYAAYVRVAADFGGQKWWSAWNNSLPATILLTQLPVPTMIGLTKDTTVPFIRNRISVQANLNLLELQDSNFDNGFFGTGTYSVFTGPATLTRVTTPVAQGAGAMSMQKITGAGDMEVISKGGNTGFRVKVGQQYTALASFRTAVTARSCSVGIGWYDRIGTPISNAYGTAVTDATTGYVQANYTAAAPAGAVFGNVWLKVAGAAVSEIHYADKVHVGTNVIIGSGTIAGTAGTAQPAVAAIYDSGYWSGSSKAIVCDNVPPNSLLVAVTASGVTAATPTNVVTSTAGLTWTSRQENTLANTGDVSISTSTNFAAGGSVTVTVTANQTNARTHIYAVTGHDEVSFGGASNKAQATSGTASVSLTTTRENSLVIVGIGDYNAVNGNSRSWRKPGINWVEDFYGDFGGGTTYFAHSIRPNAGAATEGLLSPSGQAYGIAAIEIRGATVNNIQTVYTGYSTGGLIGTASTVVERALVSTGNRNNAHPQLWSGGDWYKSTDGFYVPNGQTESFLTYDITDRYDGEGSIRWNVNNTGARLFMGWPDGPRLVNAPQMVMLGIESTQYTFSLYAKSSSGAFNSTLIVQALDQFGAPVGSPGTSTISITSSWAQYSAQLTMPTGALWVQATLTNDSSVTEQRVWVDGIQWIEGATAETIPQFGMGVSVDWEEVRDAGKNEYFITDTEAALIGNVFDNEAPPGYGIVYRAYNYLEATDTTPALASPITFYATSKLPPPGRGVWILRDPQDATLAIRLHVIGMSENMHEESQTYYPLRPTTWDQLGQRAVTITDFIGGFDGSLEVLCDSEKEWLMLRQILARPRPMWLIFPEHGGRYVRFTSRSWERQTPRTNQQEPDSIWRRAISLSFLESEAP
jgi:hypothetical protein